MLFHSVLPSLCIVICSRFFVYLFSFLSTPQTVYVTCHLSHINSKLTQKLLANSTEKKQRSIFVLDYISNMKKKKSIVISAWHMNRKSSVIIDDVCIVKKKSMNDLWHLWSKDAKGRCFSLSLSELCASNVLVYRANY